MTYLVAVLKLKYEILGPTSTPRRPWNSKMVNSSLKRHSRDSSITNPKFKMVKKQLASSFSPRLKITKKKMIKIDCSYATEEEKRKLK